MAINLKPKIEKVLVKSIKEWFKDSPEYEVYVKDNKIRVKNNDASEFIIKRGMDDEEWFFVPDYDHEEAWCFTCDGGMGWDYMNPDESGYSNDFEESVSENFKEAGLFVEPYASWKFIVTKNNGGE